MVFKDYPVLSFEKLEANIIETKDKRSLKWLLSTFLEVSTTPAQLLQSNLTPQLSKPICV